MHDHDDNVISLFGGLGHDANKAARHDDELEDLRRQRSRLRGECFSRGMHIQRLQDELRLERQRGAANNMIWIFLAFLVGVMWRGFFL